MGVIDLFRTSLTPGEVPYSFPNMYNGRNEWGGFLPRVLVRVDVLPDGRLHWEFPDNPENRAIIEESYNGPGPAPGSVYTHSFSDETEAPVPHKARNQREVAAEMAAAVKAPTHAKKR